MIAPDVLGQEGARTLLARVFETGKIPHALLFQGPEGTGKRLVAERFAAALSVVIPGSYAKNFPAGEFNVPCALIIGTRKESTDKKTSLNEALREYEIPV